MNFESITTLLTSFDPRWIGDKTPSRGAPRHLNMPSNKYYSYYYICTKIHATHMFYISYTKETWIDIYATHMLGYVSY